MNNIINPDSAMMQQLEGHWQRVAMLILWKLKGWESVKITAEDVKQFAEMNSAGNVVLLSHGHVDSMEFRIIPREEAERIAAHDSKMKGTS